MKKEERGRKAIWKTHKYCDYTDKILRTDKLLNVSDIWSQYFALRSDHQFPSCNHGSVSDMS